MNFPIPKIYAIVVTWNGSRWFEKCLSSLKSSSYPVHTIVIDNASTDNVAERIQKDFSEVELIESKKNLGFGLANNLGLKKALKENADYVFLLNQDAYIALDTIEKLVKIAERNKEYGILSPFHLNYEGTETETYFSEWVLKHYATDLLNDINENSLKQLYPTSFVHAACWLMSIETISSVGGFDPLFFHYGEDNDYVQRLHSKGKKVGIVPDAKLYHAGSNEGLKNPADNVPFLINQSLLLFKTPSASNIGAFILFFRQLIKLHFKSFNSGLSKAYRYNLKRFPILLKSRKIQKKKMSYL